MIKFNEQELINSVNGALALRGQINEVVDELCDKGYDNICWLGIGGTWASSLQAVVHMKEFSAIGGELFVMDDGWFGDKYPRNNGSSSLGDWMVCKEKLPEGIGGLIASAKKHNIKWFFLKNSLCFYRNKL